VQGVLQVCYEMYIYFYNLIIKKIVIFSRLKKALQAYKIN